LKLNTAKHSLRRLAPARLASRAPSSSTLAETEGGMAGGRHRSLLAKQQQGAQARRGRWRADDDAGRGGPGDVGAGRDFHQAIQAYDPRLRPDPAITHAAMQMNEAPARAAAARLSLLLVASLRPADGASQACYSPASPATHACSGSGSAGRGRPSRRRAASIRPTGLADLT